MRNLSKFAFAAVTMGLLTSPALAAIQGLSGEFWDANGAALDNLADADAIIASRAADAEFISTAVDYPNGAAGTSFFTDPLSTFLGADAASLSAQAGNTLNGEVVLRLTGFISLAPGVSTFEVTSDDGFRLTIGGSIIDSFAGLRGFGSNGPVSQAFAGGTLPIELIFYDGQIVEAGLEFRVNGQIADTTILSTVAPIPLPTTILLLFTALAGLGYIGWRARQRNTIQSVDPGI